MPASATRISLLKACSRIGFVAFWAQKALENRAGYRGVFRVVCLETRLASRRSFDGGFGCLGLVLEVSRGSGFEIIVSEVCNLSALDRVFSVKFVQSIRPCVE